MNYALVKVLVACLLGGALVAAQVTIAVDSGCSNTKPDVCGSLLTGASNCVDKGTDENNCGTCGNVCGGSQVCVQGSCVCPDNWPNSCTYTNPTSIGSSSITVCHNFTHRQSCSNSKCACPSSKPTVCPWGPISITGAQPTICVNTQTSENHCGACWNRCGYDEKCIDGRCSKSCGRDATLCTMSSTASSPAVSLCAKTSSDEYHCGGCFNICPRSQRCRSGKCVCTDGKAEVLVGPNKVVRCVDTRTSNLACGASRDVCPSNLSCRDGKCKCPRDRPEECPTKEGQVLCFNFKTDKSACGGCFNQCPASQKCRDRKCVD
ncbi:hypothetical protein OEZ85_012438 [Tetradesmus obliquus]|uniref:4Fe-4S ferredoxin-type domain-containing protein n=1 Tax=Tetradesmus obliquus TaxID=3088 RepID=A0ABY8TVP6_TETOB|nr:hypothetical protein OEZ85_012438 [Tetradesmus obliquus]